MALAQKPKRTAAHKKSRAQHHRQSKKYVEAYWPYLPMLFIIGGGLAINRAWSGSANEVVVSGIDPQLVHPVELQTAMFGPMPRLQAIFGDQAAWITLAIGVVALVALALFLLRHSFRLHRALNRSEAFISRHPLLDIALVLLFTTGYVLTRS